MECKKDKNLQHCSCSYPCSKRGLCCDCVTSHRLAGEIPGCFFPPDAERTYDRSVGYFIEVMSK